MSDEQWLGFRFADSSYVEGSGQRSASLRAAAFSVAIHVTIAFLVWAALILLNASSIDSHIPLAHVPLTVEKLIWQKPPAAGPASGGGGGNQSPLPVSRGVAPPPSIQKTLLVPMLVTNPDAKLQVTPTLDANAPQIAANQWGDPLANSGILSAGPGTKGFGTGPNGDGSGPNAGYGHDIGGHGAFTLGQVTTQPVLILKVEPEYSERARQAKFQGTVGLQI